MSRLKRKCMDVKCLNHLILILSFFRSFKQDYLYDEMRKKRTFTEKLAKCTAFNHSKAHVWISFILFFSDYFFLNTFPYDPIQSRILFFDSFFCLMAFCWNLPVYAVTHNILQSHFISECIFISIHWFAISHMWATLYVKELPDGFSLEQNVR